MDLLEYQAKELFHEVGIPVLPSQRIDDARDLKRLHIPYPVVLKSQVHAGGRGRAGGVRFVENTIDAIAAARTIYNLPIQGEYPQVLLAEARYDVKQEFFLAVVLDYQEQRPVLLGSAEGGTNVEAVLENMQKVVVDEAFSPFYARRLALKMGLEGMLIESVSAIIQKMYQLFLDKDLDLIEINPLGISPSGKVMALDGKISVNDYALQRHPDIVSLVTPKPEKPEEIETSSQAPVEPLSLNWVDKQGNIGILCNGIGLTLATWDLLLQEKGKLACCLVVGREIGGNLLGVTSLHEQIEQSLEQLIEVEELKVILVNIVGSAEMVQTVANAIADYLQKHYDAPSLPKGDDRIERPTSAVARARRKRETGRSGHSSSRKRLLPQIVLRLIGGEIEAVQSSLESMSLYWTDNLEQAVTEAVSFAKKSK
ncbi:MAG: ATP-grasp domain-containing protein [Chroococcales cyanobacterium]